MKLMQLVFMLSQFDVNSYTYLCARVKERTYVTIQMPQVLYVYSLALAPQGTALHSLVVGELAIQFSAPAGFLRGHQLASFCLSRSLSD